eukprot:316750-Chlamydomonas_euryale.AAC.2
MQPTGRGGLRRAACSLPAGQPAGEYAADGEGAVKEGSMQPTGRAASGGVCSRQGGGGVRTAACSLPAWQPAGEYAAGRGTCSGRWGREGGEHAAGGGACRMSLACTLSAC